MEKESDTTEWLSTEHIPDKHRSKISQQNTNKLNQITHKKDHTPPSSWIYPRVTMMVQHMQINQCDTPHQPKDKGTWSSISMDAEKTPDKIQHPFMIKKKKTLTTVAGTYLDITKPIYDKSIANIIFNNEKLKAFPLTSRTRQCNPLSPLSLLGFFFFFCCASWLVGSQFPNQGLDPSPWQWKRWDLTTGLSGNPITTSIQHGVGSPSHNNQTTTTGRNTRYTNRKERGKIVIICRRQDTT